MLLGIAYNIPVLCTYINVAGELNATAFSLYLGTVFWTVYYDTVYANQVCIQVSNFMYDITKN